MFAVEPLTKDPPINVNPINVINTVHKPCKNAAVLTPR